MKKLIRNFAIIASMILFIFTVGCADGGVDAPFDEEADLTVNEEVIDFGNTDANLHQDPDDIENEIVFTGAHLLELHHPDLDADVDLDVLMDAQAAMEAHLAELIEMIEHQKMFALMNIIRETNPKMYTEIFEDYMIMPEAIDNGYTDPSPLEYDPDGEEVMQFGQFEHEVVINEAAFEADPPVMNVVAADSPLMNEIMADPPVMH